VIIRARTLQRRNALSDFLLPVHDDGDRSAGASATSGVHDADEVLTIWRPIQIGGLFSSFWGVRSNRTDSILPISFNGVVAAAIQNAHALLAEPLSVVRNC
jgi:hypothetical protein